VRGRLLLLALAVTLAGCSGFGGGVAEPTPTPTATPTPSPTPTPEPTATLRDTPTRTPVEIGPTDTPYRSGDVSVRIGGPGDWEGSVAVDGQVRRLAGSGERRLDLGEVDTVSVNAQKQSEGTWPVTVEILVYGNVVASESSRSNYAAVRVSARFR
jgi:hypothetical protein